MTFTILKQFNVKFGSQSFDHIIHPLLLLGLLVFISGESPSQHAGSLAHDVFGSSGLQVHNKSMLSGSASPVGELPFPCELQAVFIGDAAVFCEV